MLKNCVIYYGKVQKTGSNFRYWILRNFIDTLSEDGTLQKLDY